MVVIVVLIRWYLCLFSSVPPESPGGDGHEYLGSPPSAEGSVMRIDDALAAGIPVRTSSFGFFIVAHPPCAAPISQEAADTGLLSLSSRPAANCRCSVKSVRLCFH